MIEEWRYRIMQQMSSIEWRFGCCFVVFVVFVVAVVAEYIPTANT